jgi:hypothetical protein
MTKNLMKALCAAMSEMRDPVKRSANPHFKSRFADLREVLDCIEEPLGRHGLVFTQLLCPAEGNGMLLLRSQLHHADSGEMIEAVVPIVPEKPGPQALGSCISYMRRYSAKAMFSLADADEDDDAEAATNRTSYVNIGARKPQEQPAPKAVARDEVSAPELVGAMREARNLAALDALAQKAKHLSEREKAEIREVFKARRAELQEAP